MGAVYRQVVTSEEPLIFGPSLVCASCWGCSRACAAHAIRIAEGHADIILERCVKCGACVSACAAGGMRVRDDVDRVRELLSSPRRVIAILATEFAAAMHPLTPAQVEQVCRDAGFFAVESTFLGEEVVAREYEAVCAESGHGLVLRSTCPVACDWVRMFRPALTDALMPIVPPYIAQARLVRATYGDDVAVVYVAPCFARKDEIADPDFGGVVDVAIGFDELKRLLESDVRNGTYQGAATSQPRRSRLSPTKELSLTDGFPRALLERRVGSLGGIVTVRGLEEIDALLSAIEAGDARPGIVDMLYCESCIDGPAMGLSTSGYARRSHSAPLAGAGASSTVSSRAILPHLPPVEMGRQFISAPVEQPWFEDGQIDRALRDGGFESRSEALDCGACGYPTCVEHAVAVLSHTSSWDMCVPMQLRRFESELAELKEFATLDALTGMWNRRVFDERLEHEFARYRRYGTPLSLLMVDLDSFKAVNDTYGHATGDAVLRETARAMLAMLRETDIAARYGGDEFAFILPGVDKTAAYAVAEKLRAEVAQLDIPVVGSAADETISATISVGLAAASPVHTTYGNLLERADRALYRAKEHGRDRVRLAVDTDPGPGGGGI